MNPLRFVSSILLGTALLAAPSTSAAQDATSAAAELKLRGDTAMEALHYADALVLYSEAYGASHDPALLYNLGRAYEALSENPAALDKLEQFQRQAPPELRARVPGLAERIASVRAHVATVTITSNVPGARVILGNKVIGTTPFSSPIATNAGRTTLEVSAEGYHTLRRDVDLKGGEAVTIDAPLTSKSTTGVLIIRSPNVGATAALDGAAVGTVPVELVVKAGPHAMIIDKEGFEQARTRTVVAVGERKTVDIPLEEIKPITAKWWFWTAIGVVVAGGAVTTYALLTERSASSGTIAPGVVQF